jgi:hypothetical protein
MPRRDTFVLYERAKAPGSNYPCRPPRAPLGRTHRYLRMTEVPLCGRVINLSRRRRAPSGVAHVQAGQHLVRVEGSAIERELDARRSELAAAESFYLRALHGPWPEEISAV